VNPYASSGNIESYPKMIAGKSLKVQQTFLSPIMTHKREILQQAPGRISNQLVPIYLSPQRDYSKSKQLLDVSNKAYDDRYIPVYKVRQTPYTSIPRRMEQMNYNYFEKVKTSHGIQSAENSNFNNHKYNHRV